MNFCKTLRFLVPTLLPFWVAQADTITLSNNRIAENLAVGTDVGLLTYYGTGGGTPLLSVASGEGHYLVVRQDGSLWAWGANASGQLGDATFVAKERPLQVIFQDVSKVVAGKNHSLFIKTDGSLWSMGDNSVGQLGDGTTTTRNQPVKIEDSGVTDVAAGENHSLFVKSDGSLWVFGDNSSGQFGIGTTIPSAHPLLAVAEEVTTVAAGGNHSLFIMENGSLWAMGGNGSGQLGTGSTNQATTPQKILNSGAVGISAGNGHSLVLMTDGTLWGMGDNAFGQLGNGTTTASTVPVQASTSGVSSIAAGNGHSLFIKTDGTLWAMGNNFYGQLGDGATGGDEGSFDSPVDKSTPIQVAGPGIGHVAAGHSSNAFDSMYATTGGSILVMGYNPHSLQLSNPNPVGVEIETTATFTLASGTGSTDNANYSISGNRLLTAESFDFESQSTHSIRIRATDGGTNTFEDAFTITVEDRAENNAPNSISLSNTTIAENQPVSTVVGTISGTDPDPADTLTFSLTPSAQKPDNAAFSVSGTQLLTALSFDFETQSSYAIRIRATDQSGMVFDMDFTITVADLTENGSPTALSLNNSTVAENQSSGTQVGTLTATDPDGGDTHTYALVDTPQFPDNASFQISNNLLLTAQSFDFESKQSYSIKIRVTDAASLTFDQTFTISISDLPENGAPTSVVLSNVSIAENQASGTQVGILTAIDPDVGDSHTFTLVDTAQNPDNGAFQISNNLLLTTQSFDFETKNVYSIKIRATDSSTLFTDQTFSITVADIAENGAPTGINLSNNTIAENQSVGTQVGVLTATDPDAGDSHTYTLTSSAQTPDNASFQISNNILLSAQTFDFETKPTYSIRVQATDSAQMTVEQTFTISVADLNENSAPTGILLSNATVAENQSAGTQVGVLTATDPDVVDSHTFILTDSGQTPDNAAFSISSNLLLTARTLDFETKPTYSIRIRVTDQGGTPFEQLFTITVADLTENTGPTNIILSNTSVAENQNAGTQIGVLTATDPDVGDNHTFTLANNAQYPDNASFSVAGNLLLTAQTFDFETKPTYNIHVRVADQAGMAFEKDFTINVADLTENTGPTGILLSNASVAENQNAGTQFGILTAIDADAGDSHVFVLTNTGQFPDNGAFSLNGNLLLTTTSFDFETKPTYNIYVRVTDQGGMTFDQVFTIGITNLTENGAPTNITLSNTTIAENQTPGTQIGVLTVSDPDAGDSHTFILSNSAQFTDNSAFSLNGNLLLAGQSYDFETKQAYNIQVRATDGGGLTIERNFTITITDLLENSAPSNIFLDNTTLAENQNAGTEVGTVSATDPDAGDSQIFTLADSARFPDNATFTLSGNKLFTNQPLDFESKPTHTINIRATDPGGLTLDRSFTITVSDVPENLAPTNIVLSNNSVNEAQPSSTLVGELTGTDPDPTDSLFFSLTNPAQTPDNASFFINGRELRTSRPLDYETQPTYSIIIRATDSRGLFFDKAFTILVNDTPENLAPTNITLDKATIPENQPVGTLVGNLSATDPDGSGTHVYSLPVSVSYPDNNVFTINGNQLLSGQSYDFETKQAYNLNIRVTDAQGLQLDKEFTVLITDVPENSAPTSITLSNATVEENNPAGTSVGIISATDPDLGDPHTYSLVSPTQYPDNNTFTINGSALLTSHPLDFEIKPSHTIRIRATDAGGLFFEKTFTISTLNVTENSAPVDIALSNSTLQRELPAGTTVGTLSATDPDAGDSHTFHLTDTANFPDNNAFAVSGSFLVALQSFDSTSKSSYNIRILALDNAGESITETFIISVEGGITNAAPTVLALNPTSVVENLPAGTTVGTFSTTDPDVGDTHSYQLLPSSQYPDNAFFAVSGSTLVTLRAFDAVSTPTFNVRAKSTDSGGLSVEQTFTISVTEDTTLPPINNANRFITLSNSVLAENQPIGTDIGILTLWGAPAGTVTTKTATGLLHSLQLKGDGSLWGFGDNSHGQLGLTNVNGSASPVEIQTSGVADIAAGDLHSLFLKTDGTVWAMGDNTQSQLGEGYTGSRSPTPVPVGISGVIGIASNGSHNLFLKADGSLWSNGFNTSGQLGNGTTANAVTPIQIISSGVIQIAAGDSHSLFILSDGTLWGMGNNIRGQLGNNTNTNSPTPFQIAGPGITSASGGSWHTVYTTSDGTLWGMGHNIHGQLGVGTEVNELQPKAIVIGGIARAVAGNGSTLFTKLDGSLWSLGYNLFGQLGYGGIGASSTPEKVVDSGVVTLAANLHTLYTKVDGSLWSMGYNISGQLGNGTTADSATHSQISTGSPPVTPVTFAFVDGSGSTDNHLFGINGNELYSAGNFDYETRSTYSIRVLATDSHGTRTEQQFTIIIADVSGDTNPTGITLDDNNIDENEPAGSVVGRLLSQDPQSTFSLVPGEGSTDNFRFAVRGDELLAIQTLDFEQQPAHSLRVRATNQFGESLEQIMTVIVNDLPEAPSPDQILLSDATVAENSPSGTSVGILSTGGANASFSLVEGEGSTDNALFGIRDNELIAVQPFDYETRNTYTVRIRATDNSLQSFEKVFAILVTDVGEVVQPVDITLSNSNILENAPPGTTVGLFTFGGANATYSLIAGAGSDDNHRFNINNTTLVSTETFDFETKPAHNIRVRVTDGTGFSNEKVFSILVQDVSEPSPEDIVLDNYIVAENQPSGTLVGTFSIGGPTAVYSLEITAEGPDNRSFSISGNQLFTSSVFDFETDPAQQIFIRATYATGKWIENTIQIQIADVLELPPTTISLVSSSVTENSPPGTVVGQLSLGGHSANYFLIDGEGADDNANFAISGDQLVTLHSLDFDIQQTHSIRVRATVDSTGEFIDQNLIVFVTDIPESIIELTNYSIAENSPSGTTVGQFYTPAASFPGGVLQKVDAGFSHSIFLNADGSLWTMGSNNHGQLGDGTNIDRHSPVLVMNSGVKDIAAGYLHSLIVKEDGSLWAMGSNDSGQLGDGTTIDKAHPTLIIQSGVKAVDAGAFHSLVLMENGTLQGMGGNGSSQLGLPGVGIQVTPTEVAGPQIIEMAAGEAHSLYVTLEGALYAMGANSRGQLGNNLPSITSVPTRIIDNSVLEVEAGSLHSLYIKTDGSLWGMGDNSQGQLGHNAPIANTLHVNIITSGVVEASAGQAHTNYIMLDGSLWAMGYNAFGQLGTGTTVKSHTPIKIIDREAIDVAGHAHTLFLKQDGTMWSTGANDSGQLGDGSNLGRIVPLKIFDDPASVVHFTYTLVSGTVLIDGRLVPTEFNNAQFNVVGSILETLETFDYEILDKIAGTQVAQPKQIRVRATDTRGQGVERTINIEVLDVPENEGPTDILIDSDTVLEGLPASTAVGKFRIPPTDLRSGETVSYALVTGDGAIDNPLFSVSGDVLYTKAQFNHSIQSIYSIRIRATIIDALNQPRDYSEKVFQIKVLDNTPNPVQELSLDNTAIAENLPSGTLVGQLSVTDPQALFALVPGAGDADNGRFHINGSQLFAGQSFDYETQNLLTIRIRATDTSGNSEEKAFSITVTNIQENAVPTDIFLTNSQVAENQPAGTIIGQFSVGGSPANYALVAGLGSTDNARFSISGLNLVADISFDFESQSTYSIRVQAHDPTNPSWTVPLQKAFIISIQDILEAPDPDPVGDLTLDPASVEENKPVGTLVGRFSFGGTPIITNFSPKIAAGVGHSLVLKQDGSLWSMGSNTNGQLGNGTTNSTNTLQQILTSGVVDIAAGGWHSLFLKQDGSLWGMGRNRFGQLGTGSITDVLAPVPIVPSGVTAISAGASHSMFLKSDGSLWTMGDNQLGQLGDQTFTARNSPVQIETTGVTQIAAGGYFSMYLKTGGSLWAVGDNSSGQLGDGTTTTQASPKQILSSGVSTIAGGGFHALFINSDGSVWGMGNNNVGQLGTGTVPAVTTPKLLLGSGALAISGGDSHTLILKTDGSLSTMGNNDKGQLGDGTFDSKSTPTLIVGSGVTSIATGDEYSLYILNDGTFWSTGKNTEGQLGLGSNTDQPTPIQFAQGTPFANSPTYQLITGVGDTDNFRYYIVGDQLFTNQAFDYEERPAHTIRVKGTDTTGHTEEKAFSIVVINLPEGAPQPFGTTSVAAGNGWSVSPWFGAYYTNPTDTTWKFHSSLGWVNIPHGQNEDNVWLHHPQHGWLWTSNTVYPFLFSEPNRFNAWLYSDDNASPAKLYLHVNNNWIEL